MHASGGVLACDTTSAAIAAVTVLRGRCRTALALLWEAADVMIDHTQSISWHGMGWSGQGKHATNAPTWGVFAAPLAVLSATPHV